MKKEVKLDIYTPEEELANAITHGIGILGALVAFIYVLLQPIENTAVFWSTSVFCATAFILYSSSTLYHSVKSKSKKFLFKKLDHISIYLLIAGTFTPFCWGVLGNTSLGINLLIAVWAIVIAGIVFKIFLTQLNKFC